MNTILRPSGENAFWIDAFRDLVVVVVGIVAALRLEGLWQTKRLGSEMISDPR